MCEPVLGTSVEWTVCVPTAERQELAQVEGHRLPDLSGKKIGLLCNRKPGGDLILETVAGLLRDRFDDLRYEKLSVFLRAGEEEITRMAQCDAVVAAIGD